MSRLGWKDVSNVSINILLLLEAIQLEWLKTMLDKQDEVFKQKFTWIIKAHPHLLWFIEHKCPSLKQWLAELLNTYQKPLPPREDISGYEQELVMKIEDWVVYLLEPATYDQQPFLVWDDQILLKSANFSQATVLDIGAGTGRLSFAVTDYAKVVYAVEPVSNLRIYLRAKAQKRNVKNLYVVDGLIEAIPFADNFADITMGGHVYGDYPEREFNELLRVTKPGGVIILCPGNNDVDNEIHHYLVDQGFAWEKFFEPKDGWKRKYTLKVTK